MRGLKRKIERRRFRYSLRSCALVLLCSCAPSACSFLEATGTAVGVVGKVAWEGTKAVTNVVWTGSQMAGQTASQANNTLTRPSAPREKRPTVEGERAVVFLQKEGKSYFVRARVNGSVWGRFLLDTGASAVQISKKMAKRLNINYKKSQAVPVTLAGGGMVMGRMVVLDEIHLGEVAVRNVKAIILDYENEQSSDGLLGMSFLENFVFQIDAKKNELILTKR
jgi:clan AA aspartic protease (TIGR02281 family)